MLVRRFLSASGTSSSPLGGVACVLTVRRDSWKTGRRSTWWPMVRSPVRALPSARADSPRKPIYRRADDNASNHEAA